MKEKWCKTTTINNFDVKRSRRWNPNEPRHFGRTLSSDCDVNVMTHRTNGRQLKYTVQTRKSLSEREKDKLLISNVCDCLRELLLLHVSHNSSLFSCVHIKLFLFFLFFSFYSSFNLCAPYVHLVAFRKPHNDIWCCTTFFPLIQYFPIQFVNWAQLFFCFVRFQPIPCWSNIFSTIMCFVIEIALELTYWLLSTHSFVICTFTLIMFDKWFSC